MVCSHLVDYHDHHRRIVQLLALHYESLWLMAELHVSGQIADAKGFQGANLFCEVRHNICRQHACSSAAAGASECSASSLAAARMYELTVHMSGTRSGASSLGRRGRCCRASSTAAPRCAQWLSVQALSSINLCVHRLLYVACQRRCRRRASTLQP